MAPVYTQLTNWVKEPTIQDLKSDLEAAKPSHDTQIIKIRKWNDLRELTGASKPKVNKGSSSVQPKLVRKQAEWRYSALSEAFLNSDKVFQVDPTTSEDVEAAEQNELVINYQFRTKIDRVKFVDDYVRAMVDEGTAIVRVGWERETEKITTLVPVFEYSLVNSEEENNQLQQALELYNTNLRGFEQLPEDIKAAVNYFNETGVATVAIIIGQEEVIEDKIITNKPTLDLINPENFYIDPSCQGVFEKAQFMIVSYETSKGELKKDGRFKNLDSINLEHSSAMYDTDHVTKTPNDFNFKDDTRKKIIAYEYWGNYDINNDGTLVPIVATWVGGILIRLEENPYPDKKPPFVLATYLPVKREVFGEPDAELLEDNQKVEGALMRGFIDLMGKSANAQQGMPKNYLDPVNKARFLRGEPYEYNPGEHPANAIYQHKYPEISQSALLLKDMQTQEAEALTGVKSFSGGISGKGYGDVVAGIKGALDASGKREMNITRRLGSGAQKIAIKIISMNGVFLSDKETIRITNKEFVEINREDLKGNFDLIVDISTAEIDEKKAQDLGFILQTVGPNTEPEMVRMILADIAKLKRMPALEQSIRNYKPQPDPLQEKLKELELLKLTKEVEKLDSEIELNKSKSDLNLLEADGEISGVTHERELEKQGEQARANQNLEITKTLAQPKEGNGDVVSAIGFNELTNN